MTDILAAAKAIASARRDRMPGSARCRSALTENDPKTSRKLLQRVAIGQRCPKCARFVINS